MVIGGYSFPVSGSVERNLAAIRYAVQLAHRKGVQLLAFPECALTGYPPRDLPHPSQIDFEMLEDAHRQLQELSNHTNMAILVGTITRAQAQFYNTAMVFLPHSPPREYSKRALWGWDKENFAPGEQKGVLEWEGWKIGIRICYEVRFPEYFRELYRERTDLNIVLFYDVSDQDDIGRYRMITSHLLTRAVENVTDTLSVDATAPFQTAPTALIDRSGRLLAETPRNQQALLVYSLEKNDLDFGELGRKSLSDSLVQISSAT